MLTRRRASLRLLAVARAMSVMAWTTDGLGNGDSNFMGDDADDDDANDDDVDDDVDEMARAALSLDDDDLDDYGSDDELSKPGVVGAEVLAAPALPLKGILKKSALPLAAPSAAGAAAASAAASATLRDIHPMRTSGAESRAGKPLFKRAVLDTFPSRS